MTAEQNEKFDKIINEYKKYISETNDEKKKKLILTNQNKEKNHLI